MGQPGVTLITPTRNRQQLFSLTERWMKPALENYTGEVQWIVACDSDTPTVVTLGQELSHPTLIGEPGIESFLSNMKRALGETKHDYVVIIEDDDYHVPDYLTKVMSLFTSKEIMIVGEAGAKYYHIPSLSYYVHKNMRYASWCQTAFRAECIDKVVECTEKCRDYLLDMLVWKTLDGAGVKSNVKRETDWTIGIKGLMSTNALGAGHKPRFYRSLDPQGAILKNWVGKEAAEVYFDIIRKKSKYTPVMHNTTTPAVTRVHRKRWR